MKKLVFNSPPTTFVIFIRRFLCLFISIFYLGFTTGGQLRALSAKDISDILNGYTYYDSSSSTSSNCVNPGTPVSGAGNKVTIYNFLVGDKKLSAEQAAGIMGNMQAESSFDPAKVEVDTGIGYGLIQWSFGRRSALEAAAQVQGVAVSDLTFQLNYLYKESNERKTRDDSKLVEWTGLTQQTTIQTATEYWQWNSERPKVLNSATRIGNAQKIYEEFSSGTPAAGETTPSPTTSSCAPTGDPIGTVQKVSFQTISTIKPTALILHWWGGMGGVDSLISTLTTRGLSVQIGTTVDGTVYQLTPQVNSFAEHAKCANSWAIGNEIEGGVKFGPDPGGSGQEVALDLANNQAQFLAVVKITGELMRQFNIPLDGDIAANGSTGVGVHSHKEVDAFCANGSNKKDVDDIYLKRVKDELRKQGF